MGLGMMGLASGWVRERREDIDMRLETDDDEDLAEATEKGGLDERGVDTSEPVLLYTNPVDAIGRGDGRCKTP